MQQTNILLKGQTITGASAIARIFKGRGLKRVFTYPGGTIAPLFDACVKEDLGIVCARHEQGAGYMALAIARLTRTPQVVMVTSGPGATNLATVVADAYFDSTPLVAITGQVSTADLKSGRKVRQVGFQQVDTVSLMKPIAKAVFLAESPEELPSLMEEAFTIAAEGRAGPVVVDLPMNVQCGTFEEAGEIEHRRPAQSPVPDQALIEEAARMLASAERPVIFAGQGVLLSNAARELRGLAESRNIPVVTSLLGLGSIPTDSPLSLGFAGHTGNRYAGLAIHNADLLLVVGARLDVRQTGSCTDRFVPGGKIIRVDLDSTELVDSRIRSDIDIHADALGFLTRFLRSLEGKEQRDLSRWSARIEEWKGRFPLAYDRDGPLIKPQRIIETVNNLTSGARVVVTSGVGSHQQWSARHFDFDFPARVWLTSGGHGAMGYDLPSAIGAQMARTDDLVVCFVGDGSLQMNIQELQTVVDLNVPIKIFVMDNSRLALVSQFQLLNWPTDPATGHKTNPDFGAVARAYGIMAYRLDDPAKVESTIGEALAYEGPALVHCCVDYNEDIAPMLLSGETMDRMWPYGG